MHIISDKKRFISWNSSFVRYIGLSKRNAVTFLTHFFPNISKTIIARKFVQTSFDAAR